MARLQEALDRLARGDPTLTEIVLAGERLGDVGAQRLAAAAPPAPRGRGGRKLSKRKCSKHARSSLKTRVGEF